MEMQFADREAFREWLTENVENSGVWLIFGKKGGPKTMTAAQALEEALCFGWIDGQMERIDETRYRKYFAPRRAGSNWSEKNRTLAERLAAEGKMTEHGLRQMEAAKRDGRWAGAKRLVPTQEQVDALAEKLRPYETAYANFMRFSPSIQRTYTGFSLDVKSPEAAEKRFAQLVERLELNVKPMESLAKRRET